MYYSSRTPSTFIHICENLEKTLWNPCKSAEKLQIIKKIRYGPGRIRSIVGGLNPDPPPPDTECDVPNDTISKRFGAYLRVLSRILVTFLKIFKNTYKSCTIRAENSSTSGARQTGGRTESEFFFCTILCNSCTIGS